MMPAFCPVRVPRRIHSREARLPVVGLMSGLTLLLALASMLRIQ
jgi:hypothetical protein